jgi:DNA-binding LacI/PurR family transcriptional regulator/DNA-binding transcriptional regulator YhcF (GntR family)
MDDEDSRLKYRKVEKEIRKLVEESGEGTRLPSERKLAELLGISFMTVRKGLQVLVNEGKIERKAGSGTFVAERKAGAPRVVAEAEREPARSLNHPPGEETCLGLLIFRESDAYAHKILHAFDDVSQDRPISLRHAWISEVGKGALNRIQKLADEGAQALILPWIPPRYTSGEGAEQLRALIAESPLPVTIAPMIPGLEQYCFQSPAVYGADLVTSTESLCAYFSFLGHRRIALLGPDETEDLLFQKRIVGYTYFTSRAGLENLVAMISLEDAEFSALAENWKRYQGDLAIVSYDDVYALKFMQQMARLGLHAPKDFCIIGFNDTEESRGANPPLTTVLPNYGDSASRLLDSAEAAAKGESLQTQATPSPLTFIVRQSCGGREQVGRIVREMGDKVNIICEE